MARANTAVSITSADLSEDRFSRFGLIDWWDQAKLRSAKIIVVGAGALGNEILKNLALLGVGHVLVIDLDAIEVSNLSRSVLFRPGDIGRQKADVAAERSRDLYPDCRVKGICGNVMHDLGLGVFGWADVILGALDNREARLWINRAAWKMNRPWIDGAIEGLNGVARVFLPGDPPCYECTLGEVDWKILDRRMSCKLLTREQMEGGKTPTTPTTSSVIAGIQVQEALKLLHGLSVLAGKAFVFEGLNHTSYTIEYTPGEDCMSHEVYQHQVLWPKQSSETRIAELYAHAQGALGSSSVSLDFSRDIVQELRCPVCNRVRELYACAGTVLADEARCPADGTEMEVLAIHGFTGKESYGDRTIAAMGLPPYDVFVARSRTSEMQIVMDGDRPHVLSGLDSMQGECG